MDNDILDLVAQTGRRINVVLEKYEKANPPFLASADNNRNIITIISAITLRDTQEMTALKSMSDDELAISLVYFLEQYKDNSVEKESNFDKICVGVFSVVAKQKYNSKANAPFALKAAKVSADYMDIIEKIWQV